MKTRLWVGILLACAFFSGCSIMPGGDVQRPQGRVFFGSTECGEGLYLMNLAEPTSESEPHLLLHNPTSVTVTVTIANGYDHDLLLRKKGYGTFHKISGEGQSPVYDGGLYRMFRSGGGAYAISSTYRPTYKTLRGVH